MKIKYNVYLLRTQMYNDGVYFICYFNFKSLVVFKKLLNKNGMQDNSFVLE